MGWNAYHRSRVLIITDKLSHIINGPNNLTCQQEGHPSAKAIEHLYRNVNGAIYCFWCWLLCSWTEVPVCMFICSFMFWYVSNLKQFGDACFHLLYFFYCQPEQPRLPWLSLREGTTLRRWPEVQNRSEIQSSLKAVPFSRGSSSISVFTTLLLMYYVWDDSPQYWRCHSKSSRCDRTTWKTARKTLNIVFSSF